MGQSLGWQQCGRLGRATLAWRGGRSPLPHRLEPPFFQTSFFYSVHKSVVKSVLIDATHSLYVGSDDPLFDLLFFRFHFFYSTRTLSWWSVIICIYRRLKKRIKKIWNIFWLVFILYNIYLTLLLNYLKINYYIS